ncbi:MAG: ATP-binding protein [Hyphomonadaceae bacterium]
MAELTGLIDVKASESVTLEFKAAAYSRNDDGKKELLKDLTAFANTRGGLLVIGVAEQDNAAIAITPITRAEAEAERSRINDLLRAGVDPRVFGVETKIIEVEGGVVLVVSIPRSAGRPHRVTSGHSNRFWLRNSTSAYEADVGQLRALFLQSAEILEQAEAHHRERIPLIKNGDPLGNIAKEPDGLFLHIIPAEAFSGAPVVDPVQAQAIGHHFQPIASDGGYSPRFSFDGYMNFRGATPSYGYTLVRRNGIVEATKIKIGGGADFPADPTEVRLIQPTFRYAQGLLKLGVSPPFYAYATLQGVKGRDLISQYVSRYGDNMESPGRNVLHLPVAVLENAESIDDVALAFRPAADAIWNAWGYACSPSYKDGKWTPAARE